MQRILIAVVLIWMCCAQSICAATNADFDGDGVVGFSDFLLLVSAYGSMDTAFDLNGDGRVGFEDFLLFASAYGTRYGSASDPVALISGACQRCHASDGILFMQAGWDASPHRTWRSSIMAYSSVDPYWRAKMSGEVAERPALRALIESECTACHAPLGHVEARARGAKYTRADLETDAKGQDGVSCLACHKIQNVNLGNRIGMSGHFAITNAPDVYGPYFNPLVQPMQNQTGLIPIYSTHISLSELCASCHNLYTPVIDDALNIVGSFPEQVPYSEWVVSDYALEGKTCQSCHMEAIAIQTGISALPRFSPVRTPVWDHRAVGGNTFMLSLMKANRVVLGIDERDADFDAALEKTRYMLTQRTLDLSVNAQVVQDSLDIQVTLTNKTGHKFPTGYPERRAWIHLKVADGAGRVVFESGAVDIQGNIVLLKNAPYLPHRNVIRDVEDVQIYELVPADLYGVPTRRLLSAARAIKDNRLLPKGFDPARHVLGADVGVVGDAAYDPNFDAILGSDMVTYRIALPVLRPVTVDVTVYYQPVPPEAIDDLRQFDTPDIQAFLQMVAAIPDRRPEVIATARTVFQ